MADKPLKVNKRPKDDVGDDEKDELYSFCKQNLKLPQYYKLFKEKGYDDRETLHSLNVENGDDTLKEWGIDKPGHRSKILSEINKLKPQEAKIPELPDTEMKQNVNNNENFNLTKPDTTKPDTKTPTTGGQSADKNVIIDNLTNFQKRHLFEGTCELLRGRNINSKTNEIKPSRKRLFEIKGDDGKEEVHLNDAVRPKVKKFLKVVESYSALQHSLSRSCYFNAEVQAGVAGYGGISVGYGHFNQNQSIKTKTSIYFTASSILTKGWIIVDEDVVKYTQRFNQDLDALLKSNFDEFKTENKREAEKLDAWINFLDKYGSFYIAQCEIGGAAYTSKEEVCENDQQRETKKQEFRMSAQATFHPAVTAGASMGVGAENDEKNESTTSSKTLTLNANGGAVTLASPDNYSQWEASVDTDYKLWDVVDVVSVRPFYYLLPKEKKDKVLKSMPQTYKDTFQSMEFDYKIEPGVYIIKNVLSSKVFDIPGGSKEYYKPLIQNDEHKDKQQVNQQFEITEVNNGYYRIKNKGSGLCLDVEGYSYNNYAKIQQFKYHGGDNQLFAFQYKGNNRYRIQPRHAPRLCFDVEGASLDNSARIIQALWHGGNNQLFQLIKV